MHVCVERVRVSKKKVQSSCSSLHQYRILCSARCASACAREIFSPPAQDNHLRQGDIDFGVPPPEKRATLTDLQERSHTLLCTRALAGTESILIAIQNYAHFSCLNPQDLCTEIDVHSMDRTMMRLITAMFVYKYRLEKEQNFLASACITHAN